MLHQTGTPPSTLLNTTIVGQPWADSYQLGAGVDAVTGQLRSSALEKFELKPSRNQRTEYTYSFVESRQDLEQLLETSLKGSYNIEVVKVSASTSFLEKVAISDLAVTIVAEVSVEDSEYSLATAYGLAVAPGDDFREKYGDYFVAGYRGGSSMRAVYQCRFTDTKKRQEFSAALAAEVPQVLSAEGSAKFEKAASAHGASINVEVVLDGVKGTMDSPAGGWTPASILSDVVPWFDAHLEPTPRESYLQHYRMIDPSISASVSVAPAVFADLGYLYSRFWTARSQVKTCPEFGRPLVDDALLRLEKDLEAHQASLATEPEQLQKLTTDVAALQQTLDEITHRQSFYTQVVRAASSEPKERARHDADQGTVRWGYGFQHGEQPGVEVASTPMSWSAPDKSFATTEHAFTYRDTSRIVVGWDVICRRSECGGDWEKRSDVIIGRNGGTVWVKSDYWRYTSWEVVWYTVDAKLYPSGPWFAEHAHGIGIAKASVSGGLLRAGSGEEYWTPERMRAAEPEDLLPDDVADVGDRSSVAGADLQASPDGEIGTEPSQPMSLRAAERTQPVADPTQYPYCTVGKLFYTKNGKDRSGTAFIVHKHGIMTAAHCLFNDHGAAEHISFVPAYSGGQAPFGHWEVVEHRMPTTWAQTRSTAVDLAFCTVGPDKDGKDIGDVVGWVGLVAGEHDRWDSVGYPGKPAGGFAFDGRRPWWSRGGAVAQVLPGVVAKHDDLVHGASGGPWFLEDTNLVNGLVSGGRPGSGVVQGPEFSPWVVRTFYPMAFG